MRTLALDFRDALASKDRHQMLWCIQNAKQCGIGSLVRFATVSLLNNGDAKTSNGEFGPFGRV